jgi:predicted nucleic acid-binding Zn ribbon protein
VPFGESLDKVVRSLRHEDSANSVPGPSATQMARKMGDVFGRWAEAVGDAVAAHVTPVKLDGTKLIVEVDDPAWATQLRFLEGTVKQRLLEVAGAEINTIEARVRRY